MSDDTYNRDVPTTRGDAGRDLPSYPVSGELNQGNTRPEEDPLNLTSAGGGQPLTGDKYGDKSDLDPSGDIGGSRVYNDDDVTGSAPQRSGGDYNEPTGGSGIYNDDDTTGSALRSSGDNYDEPTLNEERRRTKPTMGQKIKGATDVAVGKLTSNPAKVERGEELRGGYNQA